MRRCPTCQLQYVPLSRYATTCLPCWKKDRDYDLSKADLAHIALQEHIEDQVDNEIELQELRKKALVLTIKVQQLEQQLKNNSTSSPQLSKSFIMDLIALCHPDKHNNNEKAKSVTQKLLVMRKSFRKTK